MVVVNSKKEWELAGVVAAGEAVFLSSAVSSPRTE